MTTQDYPIAIVGGGPVGMAAAAQLTERKLPFILFEAGNSVGSSLLDWGHVRLFSPWRYNIDKAAERLLQEINWQKPYEDGLPTGSEIVKDYLVPLNFHPRIEPYVHLSTKVLSITKRGIHKTRTEGREKVPFMIKVLENGTARTYEASGVIDATGTWLNPNPIGAGGVPASGELENKRNIAYRIPDILGKDREKYADKNVIVIGSGHSAINSLLELATLKVDHPATQLHWVLSTENLEQIYGGKEDDALEARGALGVKIEKLMCSGALKIHNPYFIHEIARENGLLKVKGFLKGQAFDIDKVDEIIANAGTRPDFSITREVRVQYDPALECVPELTELIDPNIHSCGTVRAHGELELRQPEPNFYVVGIKSYGRAPTFLMATGYEQVRSIAAYLDGDIEAARKVELDLPETGVCNSDKEIGAACCGSDLSNSSVPSNTNQLNMETMGNEEKVMNEPVAASGCCGGEPTSNEDACCKLDEEKKAEGEAGCGCDTPAPATIKTQAASCC